MAFPQFRLITLLLIIGYFILVARAFIKNNGSLSRLRRSVYLFPYIIILVFYGLSILWGDYYPILLKELLKGALFLFLFLGLYQFIDGKQTFDSFKRIFFRQLAAISSLIVIFSLLTYFFSSEIAFFKAYDVEHYNSLAISLTSDYNFYALYIILGFISILFVAKEFINKHYTKSLLVALLLLLYTFTLSVSFSRRAVVVFALLIVFLLVYFVFQQYGKRKHAIFSLRVLKHYLILFSAGLIFISLSFFYISDDLKKQIAQGIKPSFTRELTNMVNRYRSIVQPEEDFETTYTLIWEQDSAIAENSIRANIRNKLENWFYETPGKTKKNENKGITNKYSSAESDTLVANKKNTSETQPQQADNIFHEFNSVYKNYFLNDNKSSVHGQGSLEYGRVERWIYALNLFENYNLLHKLFGKGFQYLNEYKQQFAREEASYDYPHSPVLSALLYSGLIGLGAYLFFLVRVVQYYWKYHSEFLGFAVFFIITVLFAFISGNSHFSIPALIFLTIIPLFYKSLAINQK